MDVDVELHGIVRSGSEDRKSGCFRLKIGDGGSTGDLLRALADRCGDPFCEALGSSDPRLPRHIRMFADGEMLVTLDQPLRPRNGSVSGVTVVVLSPMIGG